MPWWISDVNATRCDAAHRCEPALSLPAAPELKSMTRITNFIMGQTYRLFQTNWNGWWVMKLPWASIWRLILFTSLNDLSLPVAPVSWQLTNKINFSPGVDRSCEKLLACHKDGSWRLKILTKPQNTSPQVVQSCKILVCMPVDFVEDQKLTTKL